MSKRIQSFARIRPFLDKSSTQTVAVIASPSCDAISVDSSVFKFDKVFPSETSNIELYQRSLGPIIASTMKCLNTTLFAYGQTCSGKTHTLFGHKNSEEGVIFAALRDIFSNTRETKAAISFYEIYNEYLNDLLVPSNEVTIREVNGAFALSGLSEFKVSNADEALRLLLKGNENKVMGSSHLNDKSSRSHCVFKMVLAIQSLGLCEVNFVDLAGSELLTDSFGSAQQNETKNINMSLFNLKNVIFSLSENAAFIPYRNSTLTKLLQNSLGGNSQTAILNMVSPEAAHLPHSKRTLAFGQTAAKVVNNLLVEKNIVSTKFQR